jgi:hypothetical protein
MNKNQLWRGIFAVGVVTTCFAQSNIQAQTFTTASGDAYLGFRQVNAGAAGTYDLVVDIGSVKTYVNAAHTPGSSAISISQFTGTELTDTFGNLNNLRWSVSGTAYDDTEATATGAPQSTLWVTKSRTDINTQTTPYTQKSIFSQAAVASPIHSIAVNAANVAIGTPLSTTVARESDASAGSYHSFVGDAGNYKGKFQANVENNTGITFSGVSRSDFYELQPGTGAGEYLGYFELSSAGSMSFYPVSAVPEPSSYMAVGSAMLLGASMIRRWRNNRAAKTAV